MATETIAYLIPLSQAPPTPDEKLYFTISILTGNTNFHCKPAFLAFVTHITHTYSQSLLNVHCKSIPAYC